MIIWEKKGFLVAVFVFGCSLIANLITNLYTGSEKYWDTHKWPFALSMICAAVLCGSIGYYLKEQGKKVLIEKDTGKEIIDEPTHSFFFIKMHWWGAILLIIAIAVLLNDISKMENENKIDSTASVAGERTSVNPEDIYAIIDKADKIVVTYHKWKKIYESYDKKDLIAFRKSIVIKKPKEKYHCECSGNPSIYLYNETKELGVITNHHGKSLRYPNWNSDAVIADTEKWLSWFDDRNITGPREEVERMLFEAKKNKRNREKWKKAMPKPIVPLWEDSRRPFGNVDITPLEKVLKKEIPNRTEQILLLFKWFGSGKGKWNGYPSYESVAEDMLLKYKTSELIKALETSDLKDSQKEGAARLLTGWDFSRKRPEDLKIVPAPIKKMLLDYVITTNDEKKIKEAERDFK